MAEDLSGARTQVNAVLELQGVEDVRVALPRGLLYVVLANLLTNAFKFMAERLERRVEVTAREEGAGCVLTVRDTGPGISAAALPRIFEPFYRAPGAKASGHGIGLATVRRILKAHGGDISVQSVVGQGTTFTVWMPHAATAAIRG
ncbi:MAG TPA: sensor histidine kinase [Cystobacter sp.]